MSLLCARSPGVPEAEPGAGSWDDADGVDVRGTLSVRSGGGWISLDSVRSCVVASPSGSSEAGSLPSLGCCVPVPRVRLENLLSVVKGMRQFEGSLV